MVFIGMNTIFLSADCTQYVSCILLLYRYGPILVEIFMMGCNTKYSYQHTYTKRYILFFCLC